MLSQILTYILERNGAPVTDLKTVFGLPSEMAANLVIQLEDAGFVHEQKLDACHHLDANGEFKSGGGCGDGGCGSGGCSSGSCSVGDAFVKGCCGMNSPYTITDKGRAFLTRFQSVAS